MRKCFLLLCMCAVLFTGCSSKETLYIYNWTYYIPDEVLRSFEKQYNVRVVYDVFASNEEMFAKLKAGGTGYDVVFPSGDYVSIMISEGMLEKIDKTRIPHFSNLDETILPLIIFDKGNEYSVPYMMGATGIAVNTKYVKDYPRTMRIFERTDLRGKMTLLDDMREVMGHALKTLGYPVNSSDPVELEAAKQLVLTWKKNILKFDAESFAKGFAAEEFWVVQGYAENVFLELDDEMKKHVDFFIPEIGGPGYMDNMCILKDSKHKDLAYTFINYIHTPEVYAQIVDFLMLPSINVPARSLTKVEPNYSVEDLKRCEFKEDLKETIGLYNKIWQEIKVEN